MTTPREYNFLFSGYAHVHFACFAPIYERLCGLPGVNVFVSGGLRSDADEAEADAPEPAVRAPEPAAEEPTKKVKKPKPQKVYDLAGMYQPFDIPAERMLSVDEIKERDFDVVFAANTKIIMPRSAGARIQIFHGISFRNKAVREENLGADYYFIVGPYMRRAFAQAGLLPEGDPRAINIGFPKTDRLINGQLDRDALLKRLGLKGHRPVILYAPTGQKKNSLETMGPEVIKRLSGSGQFDILIKPHDHPKVDVDWKELANFEDAHTKVIRDPDVVPLLLLADLLITDASSVSSEFALRDQPMVFLDVPELLAKLSAQGGSKVDLKTWGRRAGVLVEDPAEIVDAVNSSLAHPFRYAEVRRAMAQDLFFNPGRSTDAAVDWLSRRFNLPAPTVAQPYAIDLA